MAIVVCLYSESLETSSTHVYKQAYYIGMSKAVFVYFW